MKKSIAFLVALLFAFCVNVPVMAVAIEEDSSVQPRWSYLNYIGGRIDISSSGIASVLATVQASGTVKKISAVVSLQQQKSGVWTEIKSWTVTRDTYIANVSKSWPVAHGYNYRIVVTGKAMSGSATLEQASYTANYGYFS